MAFQVDPEKARKAREGMIRGVAPSSEDGKPGKTGSEKHYIAPIKHDEEPAPFIPEDTHVTTPGFGRGARFGEEDRPAPSHEIKPVTRTRSVSTGRKTETEPSPREITPYIPEEPVIPEPPDVTEIPAAPKGYSNGMISGYVHGLGDLAPEQVPGRLRKWLTSLLTFVPYARDRAGCHFIIKPDRYSDAGARQVIVYGIMTDGFLSNGSKVLVRGRMNGNGSIRATRVYLETDESIPPSRISIANELTPLSVWLISLIIIAVLYALVRFAARIAQGAVRYVQLNLESIIIIGALVLWLLYRIARRRERRRARRHRFF